MIVINLSKILLLACIFPFSFSSEVVLSKFMTAETWLKKKKYKNTKFLFILL